MSLYEWFFVYPANNTMPQEEYLYKTTHLLIIQFAFLAIFLLTRFLKSKSIKFKRIFFKMLAVVFLFFEILYRVVKLILLEDKSFKNIMLIILPLYFCSICVWLLIVAIFSNSKRLLPAATIFGILATTAYLTYPAVGLSQRIINFEAFYSISSHVLGFVCSILLITSKFVIHDIKEIKFSYFVFFIIYLYGMLFSLFISKGSDYLFAINNPLGFKTLIPYPIYYLLIVSSFIFAFYIPSLRKKKNEYI